MRKIRGLIALAAIILPALPVSAGSAQPPPPPPPPPTWPPVPPPAGLPTAPAQPLEYAVKFVCGQSGGATGASSMAAQGNYYTAINVHNPGPRQAFVHKVTLAAFAQPGGMTPYQPYIILRYDEALDFDCRWIRTRLSLASIPIPALFTGFLVIQSANPLDVVAVYTAATLNPNQIATMHTERVPVRRVLP